VPSDPKISELSASFLCIIGASAMSYVESCIISKTGPKNSGKDTLIDIYWHNLDKRERAIFWSGLFLLVSPFFLFVLQ
jgi:hypothetical protein